MLKVTLLFAELGLSSPLAILAKRVAFIKTQGLGNSARGAAEQLIAQVIRSIVLEHQSCYGVAYMIFANQVLGHISV